MNHPTESPISHLEAAEHAVTASLHSPCQSRRGVVIWDEYGVVTTGFNHQPAPFLCDGSDKCNKDCGKTAIHAEQHAILVAPRERLVGASMLHIKTVNGVPMESMNPSCLQCSKLILESGIGWMWLLHPKGWKRYSAAEFHRATSEDWHIIDLIHPARITL